MSLGGCATGVPVAPPAAEPGSAPCLDPLPVTVPNGMSLAVTVSVDVFLTIGVGLGPWAVPGASAAGVLHTTQRHSPDLYSTVQHSSIQDSSVQYTDRSVGPLHEVHCRTIDRKWNEDSSQGGKTLLLHVKEKRNGTPCHEGDHC